MPRRRLQVPCTTCNGSGIDRIREVTTGQRWDCPVCDGTRCVDLDLDDDDPYALLCYAPQSVWDPSNIVASDTAGTSTASAGSGAPDGAPPTKADEVLDRYSALLKTMDSKPPGPAPASAPPAKADEVLDRYSALLKTTDSKPPGPEPATAAQEHQRVEQDAAARRLEEQRQGQRFTDAEWSRRQWEADQVSTQLQAQQEDARRQEAQRLEQQGVEQDRALTPVELSHDVLNLVGALSSSEGTEAKSMVRTPSPADLEVARENVKLFAEPPMWRAARYEDAIAAQGPFGNPVQNRLMYEAIGVLPLVAAAPTVSAVGAGYFLLDGSHALVAGDYEHALRAFGTALALTPGDAALNWRAERSTQRVAWALQDELERTVITHPRMRSSVTISIGVMSDGDRAARTVVSVNGGAQKSLMNKVRTLAQERGLEFIEGAEHAEVNIIREAESRGYQRVRVTASNYHCRSCQEHARSAGIDATLFSPDKGYVHRSRP